MFVICGSVLSCDRLPTNDWLLQSLSLSLSLSEHKEVRFTEKLYFLNISSNREGPGGEVHPDVCKPPHQNRKRSRLPAVLSVTKFELQLWNIMTTLKPPKTTKDHRCHFSWGHQGHIWCGFLTRSKIHLCLKHNIHIISINYLYPSVLYCQILVLHVFCSFLHRGSSYAE